MASEDAPACLAGSVRTHDGVHLSGVDREVDAAENVAAGCGGVEIDDSEHGIIPRSIPRFSRLTPSSFRASTANSIGS
jgi:hypothetical protein